MQYIAKWPEYCIVAEAPDGTIMGYSKLTRTLPSFFPCVNRSKLIVVIGKSEGRGENWHGHVTALSVAPSYRRLGIAGQLMDMLEKVSESKKCYFVDLFVRASNTSAIAMYHKLGYTVYRQVINYYTGFDRDEDALGKFNLI